MVTAPSQEALGDAGDSSLLPGLHMTSTLGCPGLLELSSSCLALSGAFPPCCTGESSGAKASVPGELFSMCGQVERAGPPLPARGVAAQPCPASQRQVLTWRLLPDA